MNTTIYPAGLPDITAIQKKLESLRELRPATIQTCMQYRMAIILGKQLRAAHESTLTDESSLQIINEVDEVATLTVQKLRDQKASARLQASLNNPLH